MSRRSSAVVATVAVCIALLIAALASGIWPERSDPGLSKSLEHASPPQSAPGRGLDQEGGSRRKPSDSAEPSPSSFIFRKREFEVSRPPVPDVLADEFEALRRLAESGSGEAAYALFLSLNRCNGAFADLEDMGRELAEAQSTRRLRLPDGRTLDLEQNADVNELESDFADQIRFCAGTQLSGSEAAAFPWLQHAAEAGYLPALSQIGWHMQHNGIGTPKERLEYFTRSLAMGFSHGAWGAYEELREKGGNTASDAVGAAAYLEVYTQLHSERLAIYGTNPISEQMNQHLRAQLGSLEASLTVDQRMEVEQMVTGIIESTRANCCIH